MKASCCPNPKLYCSPTRALYFGANGNRSPCLPAESSRNSVSDSDADKLTSRLLLARRIASNSTPCERASPPLNVVEHPNPCTGTVTVTGRSYHLIRYAAAFRLTRPSSIVNLPPSSRLVNRSDFNVLCSIHGNVVPSMLPSPFWSHTEPNNWFTALMSMVCPRRKP